MDLPAPSSLRPFSQFRPNEGADLHARSLTPAVKGEAGRYTRAPKSQHEKLVDETRTWVAQTFFGTLLKQMRDSPFKSELFSGGQGGEKFAALQDQRMAEHMTRGAGSKLVNGIVRRIEAQAAYRKQQAQKSGTAGKPVEPTGKADNRTDARGHKDLKPTNHRRASHGSPALRP
jgi:Rod binding domain-containing protein